MKPNIERRTPLGSFVPMTDSQLDSFPGTVTPEDIALLREQWQKYASPRFDDLIDTEQLVEESGLLGVAVPEIVTRSTGIKKENRAMKNDSLTVIKQHNYYGVKENIAEAYIEDLQTHISFVQEAGRKLGVNAHQLDIHDQSKWSSFEFPGYAQHFKGGGDPDGFATAFLHHIHYNPHHWQAWIFPDGLTPKGSRVEGGVVEMPQKYALEMVADWMGSSRVYTSSWDMASWLISNIPKIKIHPETAEFVREVLSDIGYRNLSMKFKKCVEPHQMS